MQPVKDVGDVVACVIDHGLFTHVAEACSRTMKKVYYWTPADIAFPKIEQGILGDGLEKVERVLDFWDVKSEVDCWVFPDIGFGGLQKFLAEQGYPVWGHHGGDEIEVNRGLFLKILKELEMDVPTYKVIKGMTKLREHLHDEEEKFVKVSRWRGDVETFHWRSWKEDESLLDCLSYKLGPAKELFTFYVIDPIDSDIEDGIDTYCIDGQWPSLVLHGVERKDKSYLGAIQQMDLVSDKVRMVNEAFGPVLSRYGYRGAFTTEVRLKDEESYFIDPTCRFPSPPSQCQVELFGNFADIIWQGANGNLIDPKPTAIFGAQALIRLDRSECEWDVWDIPKKLKQWVKPCFGCEIGGRVCLPPSQIPTFGGWLVATGDTIKEAIETLKERRDDLPCGLECDVESLASLLTELEKAEDEGVEITDQKIPDPSIVL